MRKFSQTLLLLLPMLAVAADGMQVLAPQHRTATELLPVLEPLVSPGGSITVFDNKLVVRATAEQAEAVRRTMETLDQPARQLLISVRQDEESRLDTRAAGISGSFGNDDARIMIPRSDGRVASRAEVELRDQQRTQRGGGSQQIRTEDGREAQIFLGQSLPYRTRYQGVEGGTIERVEYVDSGSGFTVLPRVQGRRVQLDISLRQRVAGVGGTFNLQSSSSSVSGPLGEWFDIGGAVQQISQSSSALLYGERESGEVKRKIMVKVDEVN